MPSRVTEKKLEDLSLSTVSPTLSPEMIRDCVQRVLTSRTFSGSGHVRELLQYLSDRALNRPADPPAKEVEIAIDFLGRPTSFDSRSDAAVRVLATRLRTKLTEYYSEEGRHDEVVIDLPRGGYALAFQFVGQPAPTVTSVLPPPAPEPSRFPLWWLLPAAVVLLALGFSLGARVPAKPSLPPELDEFWRPFVTSPSPTVLAIPTPLFFLLGNVAVRDGNVNAPDQQDRLDRVQSMAQVLKTEAFPARPYTTIGESSAVAVLTRLLARVKPDLTFRRSHQMLWEDVRSNNVIFLGPVRYSSQTKDLPIDFDFVNADGTIRNLRPRPGEADTYRVVNGAKNWEYLEVPSVLTRVSGLRGYGEILLLTSQVGDGAWAAAEYVSRQDHVRDLLAKVRKPDGTLPKAYQIVIRARFRDQVPVSIEYVTHHELQLQGSK